MTGNILRHSEGKARRIYKEKQKEKNLRTANIKFLAEPELLTDFDLARIKFGFRNRTELFENFMKDFIKDPEHYKERFGKQASRVRRS